MRAESWRALKEHFHAVSELDEAEGRRYLEGVRCGDPDMGRELEALLDAETKAGGPLDQPLQNVTPPERGDVAELIGVRVGEWELISAIASGGTSDVYRAESATGDKAPVAIKVLHRGLASPEVLRRFALEEKTLAAMRHPNIVALLGAEVLEDGRPSLVMEYVEGAPIDAHCRTAGLGIREVLTLFAHVCSAVSYAHKNLVVHRDLKPPNILVQPDGTPKVLDFGVVKLLAPDRSDATTHPGWIAPLTLRYASPEQEHGRAISTAADVYSLGVVLSELVASTSETRARDLDVILATATAEDPELRYASVEGFADDLQRYLQGEPVRARRATRAYRTLRFVDRHRLSVATSCGLLVLLLITLGFLHGQWRRAQYAESLGWRAHGEALQVTSFFHRLFDAADGEVLASDAGLLRVLDEAAASVGEDLRGFPEAEGRLRYSIARLYARLGRNTEARLHAQLALDLASQARGFDERDRGGMRTLLEGLE